MGHVSGLLIDPVLTLHYQEIPSTFFSGSDGYHQLEVSRVAHGTVVAATNVLQLAGEGR